MSVPSASDRATAHRLPHPRHRTTAQPGTHPDSSGLCVTIGLEIHIQLDTLTKAFCSCRVDSTAQVGTLVCPVCLGLPGALPVLSRAAVQKALILAFSLGSEIQQRSRFDRKSYFYPDLPKGYQITQHALPLAIGGTIRFRRPDASEGSVRLQRLHLEEDAARSIHDRDRGVTLVDLNRCGVPLVEVVTEPDLHCPEDAASLLREIRTLVRWLSVSDGNMEQGSLRCDANVSLQPSSPGDTGNVLRRPRRRPHLAEDPSPASRVEIKNLNSFRHVERALRFEIARQHRRLASGKPIRSETRLWDEEGRRTRLLRDKEHRPDYRYHHEPDLGELELEAALIADARNALVELPLARWQRFQDQLGLPAVVAAELTRDRVASNHFESVVKAYADRPLATAHWLLSEGPRLSQGRGPLAVDAERLAGLVRMIEEGRLSRVAARTVLDAMAEGPATAEEISQMLGLSALDRGLELERVVTQVMAEHPRLVDRYRAGEERLLQFFIGAVMRHTRGSALPESARAELIAQLDEEP